MNHDDELEPRDYAFLARVSSLDQARNENIDAQVREGRLFFLNKGIDPDKDVYYFLDDGVSGNINIWERPEGGRLKQFIEQGLIRKEVTTWKVNRINRRDILSYFFLVELCKENNMHLQTIADAVNTSTREGELMGGIRALFSWAEREGMMEDMVKGRKDKASKGRFQGGRIPFPFTRNPETLHLELDTVGAGIIKEAQRLIVEEGYNGAKLRQWARAEGFVTPQGTGEWHSATWERILTNPALYGEARYFTTKTIEKDGKRFKVPRPEKEHIVVKCPAIMTREEWEQMLHHFRRNNALFAQEHTGVTQDLLLFDNIRCVKCKQRYYVQPAYDYYTTKSGEDKRYKRYHLSHARHSIKPKECGGRASLHLKTMNEFIWGSVLDAANNADAWEARMMDRTSPTAIDTDLIAAERAVREAEEGIKRLGNLVSLHISKGIPLVVDYETMARNADATLRTAQTHLNRVKANSTQQETRAQLVSNLRAKIAKYRNVIPTFDHDEKRKFLLQVIDRIEIAPDGTPTLLWLL